MKSKRLLSVVGALAALLLAAPSYAAVIYDNGPPNHVDGIEITVTIGADDFTLGGATTLTDVRFWSAQRAPYLGSITWSIYADDAANNQPGPLLFRGNQTAVTRTSFGFIGFHGIGHEEFQNDFSIGSVVLVAGKYWLGLHNGQLTDDDFGQFHWEATDNATVTGKYDLTPFDDGAWNNSDTEQAFVLFGNGVPEPGTVALLAIGILGLFGRGLGFSRRKRAVN